MPLVRELYAQLHPEQQLAFIENLKRFDIKLHGREFESVSSMLFNAFAWQCSNQGADYWVAIYYHFKNQNK